MTEFLSPWPVVNYHDVDPTWWSQVMGTTRVFNNDLDPRLNDAQEFTIRSILHALVTMDNQQICEFFDGFVHLPRLLQINQQLHSHTKQIREQGRFELRVLIEDFTQASLGDKGLM